MFRLFIVACIACAVAFRSVNASIVVYDQPRALGPQDADLAGYASYENSDDNIVTFENFQLPLDTLITDIHWYGFYGDFEAPVNPVTSFDISFYNDDSGQPGTLLLGQNVGAGQFGEQSVTDPAGLANQYQYWIDPLPNPFNASANTTYYVSIQANLTGSQTWNLRAGVGDNLLWQQDAQGLFQVAGTNGIAFSLTTNDPIPEPTTFLVWSLLGLTVCCLTSRRIGTTL